jgi:hypothetical protein
MTDIADETARVLAAHYCVNCKWHVLWQNGTTYAYEHRCANPNLGRSLITGDVLWRPCDLMRHNESPCGPEGKWYEPNTKGTAEAEHLAREIGRERADADGYNLLMERMLDAGRI